MMDSAASVLVVYSAQVLLVVGVAAAAALMLPLPRPDTRLRYWRGVGLLCLALPLLSATRLQPSEAPLPLQAAATAAVEVFPPVERLAGGAGAVLVWIWAAGAAARFAWLLAGAVRLRQMRRRSTPAVVDAEIEAARLAIAPHAELRSSDDVSQPVTFGARHPVVLLPRRFGELSADAQHAVACHELLHVGRRDWSWIVVEEHLCAVLWFHPAAWWVLEQVQLAREQAIDALVAARTRSKRAYMAALLAFADAGRADAAPAIAFVRKRHLKSRLQHLSREAHMSRNRLAFTTAALVIVLGSAGWGVVHALPFGMRATSAQVARGDDPGVVLPKIVHEVKARYTPEAMKAGIEGEVWMEAIVLETGRVGEVTVIKSLDTEYGLDEQAVDALRQWRFEPGRRDGKPVAVLVTIQMTFTLRDSPPAR